MKNEFFRRGGFLKIRRAIICAKMRDNRLIGGFFNADCDKKVAVFLRKNKKIQKWRQFVCVFFRKVVG